MSLEQRRAFYGDDGPTVADLIVTLRTLVGFEDCAEELVEAADYTERVCGPTAALTPMPAEVC